MAAVSSFGSSGDNRIDGLAILSVGSQTGVKWGGVQGTGTTITYSFPSLNSNWQANYSPDDEPTTGFVALSASQQSAVRLALQYWSNVADITFQEVADGPGNSGGTIRFGMSDAVGAEFAAWAYLPSANETSGDIWISTAYQFDDWTEEFIFSVLVHEIGHALGLAHPHEDVLLSSQYDWYGYTVMAYRTFEGADINSSWTTRDPQKPMLVDILAIQFMYGANTSHNNGNTTYSWGVGEAILETIWDAGGTDTINWSNQSSAALIDLREGAWSELGPSYSYGDDFTPSTAEDRTLTIAYGTVIENANGGSGTDTIVGNSIGNILDGHGANDSLRGAAGQDTLFGGAGDDTLYGNADNDTLYGDGDQDKLFGGEGNDYLEGNGGADTLKGANGSDSLFGGSGNDSLKGGDAHDVLEGGDGMDTLVGSLGDDSILGQGDSDTIYAGDNDDFVNGGAGNDNIGGARGNDTLHGGDNNDSVAGHKSNDEIYGDGGHDTIKGDAGFDTLDGGTGNDSVIGGAGDDVLKGAGGDDTLNGNLGDDRFEFNIGDDADRIQGFVAGIATEDVIIVDTNLGVSDFTGIQAIASDINGNTDTLIDFGGGDTITLVGVSTTDLHQDDFMFV